MSTDDLKKFYADSKQLVLSSGDSGFSAVVTGPYLGNAKDIDLTLTRQHMHPFRFNLDEAKRLHKFLGEVLNKWDENA